MGADSGRTDERHGFDVLVRAQAIDHILAAMNDVEHARRNASLNGQFHQQHGRQRILFRRLEHEGVAAGDRHREHPQRNHRREVERRDAGADADRLAQGVSVDAAGDVLGELAHLQGADRARVLDHFQATENIAFGISNGLALLRAEDHGDALGVLADQRLQLEHDAHPRADRGQFPGLEGTLRGADSGIDLCRGGERNLGQHLLGGRVDDVVPLGGLRLDPFAVYQQFDLLQRGVVGRKRCVHAGLQNLFLS